MKHFKTLTTVKIIFAVMVFAFTNNKMLFAQSGQKWSLDGNTVSKGNFLGAINSTSLVFKTTNKERFTIDANGNIIVNSFVGNASGMLLSSKTGLLNKLNFPGNSSFYLSGDGTFRDIKSTISTTLFDSLSISKRLKIGNSIFIDVFPSLENNIYTDNGNLLIQSYNQTDYHCNTILNANKNTGSVGIGTTTPQKKLHIFSDNETECGTSLRLEYYVGGIPNHCTGNSVWDISAAGDNFLNFSTPSISTPLLTLYGNYQYNLNTVGIGGTPTPTLYESPSALKLDVKGHARFSDATGNNYVRLGYNGVNAIMDNYGQGSVKLNII